MTGDGVGIDVMTPAVVCNGQAPMRYRTHQICDLAMSRLKSCETAQHFTLAVEPAVELAQTLHLILSLALS